MVAEWVGIRVMLFAAPGGSKHSRILRVPKTMLLMVLGTRVLKGGDSEPKPQSHRVLKVSLKGF